MSHIEGLFEVSINGTPYRVVQQEYVRRYLDVVRQQADSGKEPSEFSLNPNDLWRRSATDWTFGAGQKLFDREDGLRRRFRSSNGVDPYHESGEFKLARGVEKLNTTTALDAEKLVTVPGAIYSLLPGETNLIKYDSAQANTTAVPDANPIVDVTTVGDVVYVATNDGAGTGNIYNNDPEWTHIKNGAVDILSFVNGRLMAAAGSDIYNITDLGVTTLPSSITAEMMDQGFTWDCFGEGPSVIFAAGRSGEESYLYQITLREDGTALTTPILAAQFPDGERVRAISTYLDVVAIVTNKGIRIGVYESGALQYGPRIYEGSDIYDVEAKDKFFYFTRDGGLGRIDLSKFLPDLTLAPSYAMDVTTPFPNNSVRAVASRPTGMTLGTVDDYQIIFLQKPDGTEDGGLYQIDESSYYDGLAQMFTGKISYGMADQKNFMFLEVVVTVEGPGDVVHVMKIDETGSENLIGSIEGVSASRIFLVDYTGEFIEFKFLLESGDDANSTTTPIVKRWTLRALPIPKRTEQILIPLDLRESLIALNGAVSNQDVLALYNELQGFVKSGEIVEYQEFSQVHMASLENVQLGPDLDVDEGKISWEGVATVTLRIYDDAISSAGSVDVDESQDMFGIQTFGEGTFGDRD